ncbi:VG15 protein [Georgenia thermotolerans]|uniref:VG15 protein n=1 Tax=Georgenia thermotolerans TaxID=527326 RepID=UPI00186B06BF|nr:hypothetical protein [Georgenia thermotolerans]
MATATDVGRLREANAALETLALDALRGFWASLDLSKPEKVRDALVEFLPALTAKYGEVAAVVAADWYDELRASMGVRGRFAAVMAAPVPAAAAVAQVRFGAQHLFTPTPQQTLAFLEGVASKYVLQPGRDTVQQSAAADPAASGWHRETRHEACDFCRLLAGRGGVYRKATAAFAAHHNCHCVAVPSWDANAPEVPVEAYVASQRLDSLRRQAAGEPVTLSTRRKRYLERRGLTAQEDAQRQLDAHRARVREYMASMDD